MYAIRSYYAEWGAAVARHLPNSVHLVMAGVSHAPFPECAQGIMAALVERGSVADLDTSCVAALERAPFQTGGRGAGGGG